MKKNKSDERAYKKIVDVLKSQRQGITIADITAKTALPLETVKELVVIASDEFSGRLQVTESGEILYSFPRGFQSKYRGPMVAFKKLVKALKKGAKTVGTWLFKTWIMLMLVGYFILFMAIALVALLASTVISVSGSSDNRSNSRRNDGIGSFYAVSYILDLIIRIWFYSEVSKSIDRSVYGYNYRAAKPKGRPLHHAVFSFVFGDGDPNADWEERERKAVISYIQANKGIISLPEFMILTGAAPQDAEQKISRYCVEFGGMPEASEDGTVLYRFEALLLRSDTQDRSFAGLSAPIKRLQVFSKNSKKMNSWFAIINGVNLVFGSYFLYFASTLGPIVSNTQVRGSSYLYAIAFILFSGFFNNPLGAITIILGFVPVSFAVLFYLIPAVRYYNLRKTNEQIKLENLRKTLYQQVWEHPQLVHLEDVHPAAEEYRPKDFKTKTELLIKELGTYSIPEVKLADDGSTIYSFPELEREKLVIYKIRSSVDASQFKLGNTIFDSHSTT
ncbi:hypothetical protein [Gracilinema caldarium]|uniref:Uncharacterized protein n=1 Tax=Gracilinema caldarium (strain ATCC 51460 / DSM 7334 / H1) TaxID=744872 RepID=F8F0Q0_GRAC1|nr:hypothetical protein [Gracilinema caldarium]AEJ19757.1 hypothetical protein Spica_1614 [Gracilinema caldarium DSM 7334]